MQTPQKTPSKGGYNHLSQTDRDRIQSLLDQGVDEAEIGRIIGRHKSTVGREILRNKRKRGEIPVTNPEQYEATSADHKAYIRRLYASYDGKKIQEHDELRAYVIQRLKWRWNPDEIAGAMKQEHASFYASKTTIYEWLYSEWGQAYCRYLYSQRHTGKKRKPKAEKHMIPDRVSYLERPAGANDRTEYGHWEGDTVVSGKKTGSTASLAVVVERKARYIAARKIPNLRPASFNGAVTGIRRGVTKMSSLTLDNGLENRWHKRLAVPAYFCDPYSSWQKGGVENANKMIRRYLPKGMDLAEVSHQRLTRIIALLNNKPRKILGYKSALQVMNENDLLTANGNHITKVKVALRG